MKSGIFGLVCPETQQILLVTSSEDIDHAVKKYQGDLRKMIGSPEVYRWLCELRKKDLVVKAETLEHCPKEQFSEVKRKWVKALKESGQAQFNVNFSK